MVSVKKLFKSAGVYFLGNVLTRLISFFLLPLYTSYLATNDMGYYDVSTTYLNILVPVICLEIWSGIMRFMFDFTDKNDKYKVIFNGMVIFSGSVAIYTILFVALGIVKDIDCIVFIFFYGVLMMLQNIYTFVARGLGYNQVFAVSGIVSSLVNSVSNIIMILLLNMRLESLYIAMIIGLIVQLIILELKVKIISNISFKMFDFEMIKSMAKFSVPLCLNSACFWFLSSYNKIGIKNTLGLDANGIYSVAGKFTMAVAIVANCFSLAWQEMVYSIGNQEENKSKLYTTALNYCVTLLMFGELLIIPFVNVIFPYFVDSAYNEAYRYVPLYMFATAMSTLSSFLGNIFGAEKKTNVIFYSTVVAAIVNVGVFHLFVGNFGLEAANIGLSLGYVINIILRIIILNKSYTIKIDYLKIAILILIHIPVYYVYLQLGLLENIITFFAVSIVMLFMFKDTLKMFFNKISGNKKLRHKD